MTQPSSSPYDDPSFPLPLAISTDDEVFRSSFPDGEPTPTTPLGAAIMWQAILLNPGPADPEARNALDKLVVHPEDWNGYTEVAEIMSNWAIMSVVVKSEERDDLAYVKFMPDTGHSMQAFGEAPLNNLMLATLVRFPDGWWRVFAIGHQLKAADVFR